MIKCKKSLQLSSLCLSTYIETVSLHWDSPQVWLLHISKSAELQEIMPDFIRLQNLVPDVQVIYEHLSFVIIMTADSKRGRGVGGRNWNFSHWIIASGGDSWSHCVTSVDVKWQSGIQREHKCDKLPCIHRKERTPVLMWRFSKIYLHENLCVCYSETNSNSIYVTVYRILDVPNVALGRESGIFEP